MARLSGLPSEHHHEGPGDAPRRKRGRPTKGQASSQSQSQPQSQSQDVVSTGKRTASPTAELSQTKRARRVPVDDEDQIADEMEQSFSRSQRGDTIRVETQSSTSTTRRAGRRHSEYPTLPVLADADDDDDDDELAAGLASSAQASSGLTPHLNRIGAVRRDLATARRVRRSLPSQLGVERVDEEANGTQFQYAPLSAVLDGRTRRRLRRSHLSQEVNDFENHQKQDKKLLLQLREQLRTQDAKIKDLEYRLEAGRLGNIDMTEDHAQELAQELDDARQEIVALRASSLYNGSEREMSAFDGAADLSEDDDDGEQLLLVNPDELHLARDIDMVYTRGGKFASRVQELSSQMTFESLPELSQLTHDTLMDEDDIVVPDKIEDQAVERYERELAHTFEQLARSQAALRVLTLELQNLHYVGAGRSGQDIIIELRHGFDTLRVEIEKFIPNSTTNLTNQQLLRKIPELISGIFFELNETTLLLSSSQNVEIVLRRQYENVLDLLGDSEEHVKELEKNAFTLDRTNEQKQRTIVDLEEQVTTLIVSTNNQDAEITDMTAQINGLRDEVAAKDTALARLRDAIETYRVDILKTTQTALDFETAHHATISRMEEEHSDAIRALTVELTAEQDAREAAEGDAQQKGEIIDDLASRIERMEIELGTLTDEMAELTEQLALQTDARGAAESQRDEQATMAYEYANTIENLKETILDLKAQLKELQANLASERSQREKTEAALDEATEKIDDQNVLIHDAGIQANELRSKLFQLQQEKDAAIIQLQEDAQEREDDLNEQLVTETQARGVAEKTVVKLNKQIEQLQGELATADIDLSNMTDARQLLEQDREQQVLILNQQIVDLTVKYTALDTSSRSTIDALQAKIIDLTDLVRVQQTDIERLTEEGIAKDLLYKQDTTVLKEDIAELKGALINERAENEQNRKEITSLSQRVENEANELLNMVNSHSEETTALNSVISIHEATIKNHKENARRYEEEYTTEVTELSNTIEELQLLGTARVETITILQTQIETLKTRFAKQEEDTRTTIDALNLAHRRLLEENEAMAAALKQRNADTLKAVQEMKSAQVIIKTSGVDMHLVQNGKVQKTTEKVKVTKKGSKKKMAARSWRDSGMFDEEEGDTRAGDQEAIDDDLLPA
jgi:chromosome segregation ATPase